MRSISRGHVLSIAISLAALVGACGPAPTPTTPTGGTAGAASTDPPPDPTADPGAGGAAAAHGHGDGEHHHEESHEPTVGTPLTASKLLADVQALGIDMNTPPELGKIPKDKKKKLMKLFVKSIGAKDCQGCHVEGDFHKETMNKKIARGMWNNFIVKLRDEKGGPIFCDTCHNGKDHLVPRKDEEATKKMMEEQYEGKLTRADKEELGCTTCHDDTMEKDIFGEVWGIK